MKVWIRKPYNWFGPYQLADALCFWVKDIEDEYGIKSKPHWVHQFGEWLAHGSIEPEPEVGEVTTWDRDRPITWLYKFLTWVDKQKQKIPREMVKIDRWDTWSMDHTLAPIILPMLKQLRESKQGSQIVDLKDVPKHMRTTETEDWDDQKCFDFYNDPELCKQNIQCGVHDRWDWVMGEMIFAFESYSNDWEDKYHMGVHDLRWKKLEDGMSQMIEGPDHTHHWDVEGWQAESKRIDNGFRLFGKYFRGLWD